jgi:hypothetical protein
MSSNELNHLNRPLNPDRPIELIDVPRASNPAPSGFQPVISHGHEYFSGCKLFSQDKNGIILLTLSTIVEVILAVICLSSLYWFRYCYWDFSLTHVYNKDNSGNYTNLSSFKNTCQSQEICPQICESISPIVESSKSMITIGFISIVVGIIVNLLGIIKYFKRNFKIHKFILYFMNTLPFVLLVIGFAVYMAQSEFSDYPKTRRNSEHDHTVSDLDIGFGMFMSVICMIIMCTRAIASPATIGPLYW